MQQCPVGNTSRRPRGSGRHLSNYAPASCPATVGEVEILRRHREQFHGSKCYCPCNDATSFRCTSLASNTYVATQNRHRGSRRQRHHLGDVRHRPQLDVECCRRHLAGVRESAQAPLSLVGELEMLEVHRLLFSVNERARVIVLNGSDLDLHSWPQLLQPGSAA